MDSPEGPRDRRLLLEGIRAGASFGIRVRVAVAILLSLLLVGILLPVTAVEAPHSLYVPVLIALLVLPVGTVFSVTAGAVTRTVARGLAGWPESHARSFGESFRRIVPLVGTPTLALAGTALLFGLLLLLVQTVRVPAVGPFILLLLLPVVLAISWGTVRLFVRWFLSGHLSGTAVSVDGVTPFVGLGRGFSYLKTAPWRVLGLRAIALLAVLGAALLQALVLGLPVLALVLSGVDLPGIVGSGIEATWRAEPGPADVVVTAAAILLLCWFLSAPVAMAFGGRAALYLIHRRALDGIPVDAPPHDAEAEKTLEELGVELVESLKKDVS